MVPSAELLYLNGEAQKLAVESKHQFDMQAAKLASEERQQGERLRHDSTRQARRHNTLVFCVLVTASLAIAAGLVTLVVKNLFTREHAIILGGGLSAVFFGLAQKFLSRQIH
jgi:hypothetical protein